ncbi:methionyl-tRNA formyltransferase [Candidatus Saccharibacteria bacterium]|nr:methionyl-tRNA formyltransferase [Candidatus Saccharibacteria bacterium]
MPKHKVVFFGTGPVAARSLELLLDNFEVEAVVTKPKPEHHRGDYPVLAVAERNLLKVILVSDKASISRAVTSHTFTSKLAVLIDFGIIVEQDVIDTFELGIVNSHFSLLPQWRGADPITFSVLSGQTKTGVSLMMIEKGMDTGKLIGQRSLKIDSLDTTPKLTDKLIALSDEMLVDYLPRYVSGEIKPRQQPHPDRATYSRKLTKQDGVIDWTKPAEDIEREIRAFVEWPKSRAKLGSVDVIITKAHSVPTSRSKNKPGDVEIVDDIGVLMVECGNGSLCIEALKPAGKNVMSAADFIRGYRSKLD